MAHTDIVQRNHQRTQSRLARRTEIRKLLQQHRGAEGFSSASSLAAALDVPYYTVREDIVDMGIVKVREGGYSYLTLPVHNPAADEMRNVEIDVIESTLFRKIQDHVVKMQVAGLWVVVDCERGAGAMLYEWFSLLQWKEIVFILEQRHSVLIRCSSEDAASIVLKKLTGG